MSKKTRERATDIAAQIPADAIAERRTMGAVYMDGSHNPHAGEIHWARQVARDLIQALEISDEQED